MIILRPEIINGGGLEDARTVLSSPEVQEAFTEYNDDPSRSARERLVAVIIHNFMEVCL